MTEIDAFFCVPRPLPTGPQLLCNFSIFFFGKVIHCLVLLLFFLLNVGAIFIDRYLPQFKRDGR